MPVRTSARWRALAELLRPEAGRWVALGVLVAVGSALTLTGPLLVRAIVDRASEGTTTEEVLGYSTAFLAVAVLAQVMAVVVVRAATVAAWRTTNGLRLSLTEHVLRLDHEFHRTHTPGELIQRVDGDVTYVSDFLGMVLPRVLGALFLVSGMIGVLVVIDWRVAVGMFVYVLIAVMVVVRSRHRAVGEASDEMGANARLYGGIEERLTAAEDLRALGAEGHASWRFIEDSSVSLETAVRRESAFLSMWWLVQMAVAAGWVLVLVLGAWLVDGSFITLGTSFLLYQYVLLISRPLEEVVHQLETVQRANGAMVRVLDLQAIESRIDDSGTVTPPTGALSVELRDVTFDYGDDLPVLRDVSLGLGAGRSLGIVGRTGSGKTTLSRLVLRLVEARSGAVLLGGVRVQDMPLTELRRRVAVVPQEVELFSGSVRDNVALFDDARSDADVEGALRSVGLGSLVDSGIHRPLGMGGGGLSAGEAQLLALARVWLRDPDLVVLDEATARVDPETESQLEEAIAGLLVGRTALVIAHRLSTLKRVDEIAVFDHGHLVEHGEREALAGESDSRYRHLLTVSLETEEVTA